MKNLEIEWRHLEKGGRTCLRCSETGKTLAQIVSEMAVKCRSQNIAVTLKETKLSSDCLCESNSLLFNGVPLEELIAGTKVAESYCASCSELTGVESFCRTVEREGETYETIPEPLIWEAACRSIGCEC